MRYVNTKDQIADLLTKGAFTAAQWNQLCSLASVGESLINGKPQNGFKVDASKRASTSAKSGLQQKESKNHKDNRTAASRPAAQTALNVDVPFLTHASSLAVAACADCSPFAICLNAKAFAMALSTMKGQPKKTAVKSAMPVAGGEGPPSPLNPIR